MRSIKATEAARGFGQLIEETQSEAVTIEKNGRPVAVIYSYHEAQQLEALKLAELKRFVDVGIKAADEGRTRPLTKAVMAEIKARGHQRFKQALKS